MWQYIKITVLDTLGNSKLHGDIYPVYVIKGSFDISDKFNDMRYCAFVVINDLVIILDSRETPKAKIHTKH